MGRPEWRTKAQKEYRREKIKQLYEYGLPISAIAERFNLTKIQVDRMLEGIYQGESRTKYFGAGRKKERKDDKSKSK
jgi:DNA invertase Pin-like site-specific DNA recombinase